MPNPSPDPDLTGGYDPPPAAPAERFAPGALLAARYRVVAPLGKGGMGEVYRADDLTLGQPVALKFLPAHIASDPDRLARFRKEVAAARKVSHPNVCRVYDIADHDGQPFLTMEFVDGEDLSSVLKRLGRVPEEKGVEIARQLCGALAAVHDEGLLHRDLKPANVMLDGRGKVRLTDFGLAAAEAELSADDARSGTPLYQAPEQLAGREVTARSDLYALGLVLYELFTGKRAFVSTNRDTPPSKLSAHVAGLSPALEALILKCLEPDPAARPRTAVEVLAALPGGDPLAAALAAGQTPSPQMVADAGEAGLIRPWVGGATLGVLVVALIAFGLLRSRVMVFEKIGGLPKSTEWLSGKARDVREMAGYPDRTGAVGYDYDQQLFKWIEKTDKSSARWERLNQPPAAPLVFWYRESPATLIPGMFYPYPGSVETTRVTWTDPAPTLPGMTGVRLTPDGRLLEFYAVPSEQTAPADRPPDWGTWFKKTQLSLADFRPTTEHGWVAPVFTEKVFTWVPTEPRNAALPTRVEAGTHRDRVVWFRVAPVWVSAHTPTPAPGAETQGSGDQGSAAGSLFVYVPLVIAVLVLAPVTLRSGRADKRGAFLLGTGVFAIMVLVWAFETRHVFGWDEVQLFVFGVASAFYWAALVGFSYLVLEPFVRKWWPETVISWNRLLVGRWRDPLVGRDLIAGVVCGTVWTACAMLTNQLPAWAGETAPMPWWDWWVPNTQVPGLWTGNFLINVGYNFRFGFFYCLLLLLLLRVVFRRPWLAGVAFILATSTSVAYDYGFHSPSLGWPLILFGQVLMLFALVRFGVLSMIAAHFAMNVLWFPMTTDPARDYFANGLLALGSLLALAVFGCHTATGGRPFGPTSAR
jgi:serine/threonine-protein kinase